jgi:phage terminase small subunit
LNSAALTAKQAKFVAEYLVDGNGSRAAIAAGYGRAGARVRAHRLTRDNTAVMAEIARRQAEDGQRLDLDRAAVIRGLQAGIEIAKERMDAASVIRGFAELGRLLGYYQPQRHAVEVAAEPDSDLLHKLHAMSDAELSALIRPAVVA